MDICLWRYNITIEGETVRSPKSFVSKKEALRYITDSAYALARTYSGGANTHVTKAFKSDHGTYVICVYNDDVEVIRFELHQLANEDSLVNFKLEHPYMHKILNAITA